MEVITATLVLDVNDVSPGWHVNGLSVGPSHEPIVYLTEAPDIEDSLDEQPLTRLRILHQTPNGWHTFEIPDMLPWHRHVQPLPDGSWLVVGFFPSEQRRPRAFPIDNARVYDADGRIQQSFYAGKCVVNVQATSDGLIWYGFGDEGVLSDRLSSKGLACRDLDGNTLFGYSSFLQERIYPSLEEQEQRRYSMIDCSALNVVSEDDVWICYWGGNHGDPIVRLNREGIQQAWMDNPILGKSMAVDGRRVLFGHVHDLDGRFLAVSLDSLEMIELLPVGDAGASTLETKQRRYPSEDVTYDAPAYRTAARGSKLYTLTDDGRLYLVDLSTIEVDFIEAHDDVSLDAIERRIERVPTVLAMRGIIAVLVRHWASNSRARNLLARCFERVDSADEDAQILVGEIIDSLAHHFGDDVEAQALLVRWATECNDSNVRARVIGAISDHWPKDERMRDLLLD